MWFATSQEKNGQTNHLFVIIKAETKLKMLLNPTRYVEEVVYNKPSTIFVMEAHIILLIETRRVI